MTSNLQAARSALAALEDASVFPGPLSDGGGQALICGQGQTTITLSPDQDSAYALQRAANALHLAKVRARQERQRQSVNNWPVVGQVDPLSSKGEEQWCNAAGRSSWECTRLIDHAGPHAYHDEDEVTVTDVWAGSLDQEDSLYVSGARLNALVKAVADAHPRVQGLSSAQELVMSVLSPEATPN